MNIFKKKNINEDWSHRAYRPIPTCIPRWNGEASISLPADKPHEAFHQKLQYREPLGCIVLKGCDLAHMDFSHACMDGAHFNNSSLRFVDLTRACVRYADFRNTDITGVCLTEANITGVIWTGAHHSGRRLSDKLPVMQVHSFTVFYFEDGHSPLVQWGLGANCYLRNMPAFKEEIMHHKDLSEYAYEAAYKAILHTVPLIQRLLSAFTKRPPMYPVVRQQVTLVKPAATVQPVVTQRGLSMSEAIDYDAGKIGDHTISPQAWDCRQMIGDFTKHCAKFSPSNDLCRTCLISLDVKRAIKHYTLVDLATVSLVKILRTPDDMPGRQHLLTTYFFVTGEEPLVQWAQGSFPRKDMLEHKAAMLEQGMGEAAFEDLYTRIMAIDSKQPRE